MQIWFPLVIISVLAYVTTNRGITMVKDILKARGIFGIDINKITESQLDDFRKLRAVSSVAVVVKDERFKRLLVPWHRLRFLLRRICSPDYAGVQVSSR